MKNIALLCLVLTGMLTTKALSQPSESTAREKLKPFGHWVGHWSGEGYYQTGSAERQNSTIEEHLTYKLNGTVLQVEGTGTAVDPATGSKTIVHNALAILYYDQSTQQYRFNSFLQDGRHADAWFNIVSDNKYEWGFDLPTGKIRYIITFDEAGTTWNEVGEFSPDKGTNWYTFFGMTLKKR